jgi:hypothetical protein
MSGKPIRLTLACKLVLGNFGKGWILVWMALEGFGMADLDLDIVVLGHKIGMLGFGWLDIGLDCLDWDWD